MGHGSIERGTPIIKLSLVLVGALSAFCIAAGVFALFVDSVSSTTLSMVGLDLTTAHVGVALVAIGMVSFLFVIRRAFTLTGDLVRHMSYAPHDRGGDTETSVQKDRWSPQTARETSRWRRSDAR